ncbi:hypothetical protein BD779DRAFT_1500965 [Infundibulicybe gibba]|nr:hypothetical protein BD779DRAFT_1500965 [Infundibulicybe gibba]
MKNAGIYYLEHESFKFASPSGGTWSVYGSPSAPVYALGAFQYRTTAEADGAECVKIIYGKIPPETEILLSHTPPYFTLDKNKRGKFSGCDRLARRLDTLDACRLHVFGHIHEAAGARIIDNKNDGRVAVNAAMPLAACAIIVDLKKNM